jgi:hypothetical protein
MNHREVRGADGDCVSAATDDESSRIGDYLWDDFQRWTAYVCRDVRSADKQKPVAFDPSSIYEKEKTTKWRFDIKHLDVFTATKIKRCGECKNSLTDQKMGIDGAMCGTCVEALAPWMNEPVDPYLLALWSISGYGWLSH